MVKILCYTVALVITIISTPPSKPHLILSIRIITSVSRTNTRSKIIQEDKTTMKLPRFIREYANYIINDLNETAKTNNTPEFKLYKAFRLERIETAIYQTEHGLMSINECIQTIGCYERKFYTVDINNNVITCDTNGTERYQMLSI